MDIQLFPCENVSQWLRIAASLGSCGDLLLELIDTAWFMSGGLAVAVPSAAVSAPPFSKKERSGIIFFFTVTGQSEVQNERLSSPRPWFRKSSSRALISSKQDGSSGTGQSTSFAFAVLRSRIPVFAPSNFADLDPLSFTTVNRLRCGRGGCDHGGTTLDQPG
jgi:hypothetical protein